MFIYFFKDLFRFLKNDEMGAPVENKHETLYVNYEFKDKK